MNKPKIVLINPPHPYLNDQKRNQPLGLLYLAAVIENAGYNIEMVDLRDTEDKDWSSKIPDATIYGISATAIDYNRAVRIATVIKKEKENSVIVLGGSHATLFPNSVDYIFDKIVIGEGENAFLNIISDYTNNNDRRFYEEKHIEDLDSVPFPARHLLPRDSIISYSLVEHGKPATSLITSRGCNMSCSFCGSKLIWGNKVKFRSPENVITEIKQIMQEYGIHHFRFLDDTITLNKPRILELCKLMEPLNIHWRAHTRVDKSSIEVLSAMKNAGCDEIGLGIESASQEVLNIIQKKTTVEQCKQAIRNAKQVGLKVRLFFIVGLPGETKDTYMENIKFIEDTNPDGVDLSTFVPFPGCDIYYNPKKYGIKILSEEYDKYTMTLGLRNGEYETDFLFSHPNLSNNELKESRKAQLDYIISRNMVLNK